MMRANPAAVCDVRLALTAVYKCAQHVPLAVCVVVSAWRVTSLMLRAFATHQAFCYFHPKYILSEWELSWVAALQGIGKW